MLLLAKAIGEREFVWTQPESRRAVECVSHTVFASNCKPFVSDSDLYTFGCTC